MAMQRRCVSVNNNLKIIHICMYCSCIVSVQQKSGIIHTYKLIYLQGIDHNHVLYINCATYAKYKSSSVFICVLCMLCITMIITNHLLILVKYKYNCKQMNKVQQLWNKNIFENGLCKIKTLHEFQVIYISVFEYNSI